ncbi:hypothetical protein HYC85_017200 [Camellia sinensis]|uniref:Uncharacterized protein n=1 Tax=Camellia sinensis TaxID=4442 RepID=A0A7J7H1X3_CAMSI|nr:hypothetical protein HYC85_017200 [Camellia sinensis]
MGCDGWQFELIYMKGCVSRDLIVVRMKKIEKVVTYEGWSEKVYREGYREREKHVKVCLVRPYLSR